MPEAAAVRFAKKKINTSAKKHKSGLNCQLAKCQRDQTNWFSCVNYFEYYNYRGLTPLMFVITDCNTFTHTHRLTHTENSGKRRNIKTPAMQAKNWV